MFVCFSFVCLLCYFIISQALGVYFYSYHFLVILTVLISNKKACLTEERVDFPKMNMSVK